MKRFLLTLFVLCLLFTAAACKRVTKNEKTDKPTLVADTVCTQGEDVVVKVNIKNNPGVLTLFLNTTYDENALQLTKIESGKTMEGYTFTAPKNLRSNCNAMWNILDVPNQVTDGEVALLHFKLKENIAPGNYEIAVTCNRGAYDAEYKEISFESVKGQVVVNSTTETKEESK